MTPELTIVVMAYNEAASLKPTVTEIETVAMSLGCSYEILLIDDGSRDGTGNLGDQLAMTVPSLWVIHHSANGGLGEVYRTGFTAARGRFVTFFPADGQFPASILATFYQTMPEMDMVLGYLPGRRDALLSRCLSLAERALYAALFGPMPKFQGVLMFRRSILDGIDLRSTGRGWAVLMEFIIRACRSGARVTSLPTTIRPRTNGFSKVNNFRTIQANVLQLVALRRHL
jgi:dolichol-phosphate mannosyltransferase